MGGRRLHGAQRDAFWRGYLSGLTIEAAALATGVSERSGREWVLKAGGVSPVARTAPIPVLARRRGALTLQEREEIAILNDRRLSCREIGRRLRRAHTTISRELDRNRPGSRKYRDRHSSMYRASGAQTKADRRRARPKATRLAQHPELLELVQLGLTWKWSPEQIAAWLGKEFPDNEDMQVSHETIYKAIYVQGRGELRRDIHKCLRTGRALRKPNRSPKTRGRIPNKVMISERPAEVADRAIPGHWEGDLIVGKNQASAIGTLVERTTRFVILLHLPIDHTAESVRDQIIANMADWPAHMTRSLTWDQGNEMARHEETAAALDLDVYFCDPHSPWQRGTNENTNGLLRQYFPKGTDLSVHTPEELARVAMELNLRPRKTLGWQNPYEALTEHLLQSA